MRLVFALSFCSALLIADCRTSLGIPCHTIEYTEEHINFFHRDITDLSRVVTQSGTL